MYNDFLCLLVNLLRYLSIPKSKPYHRYCSNLYNKANSCYINTLKRIPKATMRSLYFSIFLILQFKDCQLAEDPSKLNICTLSFLCIYSIHQVWMVFARIGNGLCFCYSKLNLHSETYISFSSSNIKCMYMQKKVWTKISSNFELLKRYIQEYMILKKVQTFPNK